MKATLCIVFVATLCFALSDASVVRTRRDAEYYENEYEYDYDYEQQEAPQKELMAYEEPVLEPLAPSKPVGTPSLNGGEAETYSSCSEIGASGITQSGVYTLTHPNGLQTMQVYCDLKGEFDSWMVIQRRTDGSENFERNWNDYKNGFGKKNEEFWLGNENLYKLTSSGDFEIRFDLQLEDGTTKFAQYGGFKVGNEESKYALSLKEGSYQGDAGDDLLASTHSINGLPFTTIDEDNDEYAEQCAKLYHGGWWYKACHYVNPNGLYGNKEYGQGINWKSTTGFYASLAGIEIRIRKVETYESCAEVPQSGSYTLTAMDGYQMDVFCELKDGEAWTVIQRRTDGSQDFKQDWEAYKNGFGNMKKEFWLGNEKLHQLTSSGDYELRFDMTTNDGESFWASYQNFRVGSEQEQYPLSLAEGSYKGDAGDEILDSRYSINGLKFTTIDVDNDAWSGECAKSYHGGWWYKACHVANPNGLYGSKAYGQGVIWRGQTGFKDSLKTIEMKMRPME